MNRKNFAKKIKVSPSCYVMIIVFVHSSRKEEKHFLMISDFCWFYFSLFANRKLNAVKPSEITITQNIIRINYR